MWIAVDEFVYDKKTRLGFFSTWPNLIAMGIFLNGVSSPFDDNMKKKKKNILFE